MNGIMGEPEPETVELQPVAEEPKAQTQEPPVETAPVKAEEEPAAVETKRRGVGRPKKVAQPEQPEDIRATFVMNPEQQRQIKYISLMEGKMLKTILAEALAAYIENWQAENGRIPSLKKKK